MQKRGDVKRKRFYHVQQFGNKVGQADETLDLSAAFSAFLSDNIGGFKIPDKLSGILKQPILLVKKAVKVADKSNDLFV